MYNYFLKKDNYGRIRFYIKKSIYNDFMQWKKSLDKLDYFKRLAKRALKDAFTRESDSSQPLKKSLLIMEKAGYPIGTIRVWKGKKFIKIAPNKWRPKYDEHSRGAKNAITRLMHKVDACNDSRELLQLVLANKARFSDSNGRPYPWVQELSEYCSKANDRIQAKKKGDNGNSGGVRKPPKTSKMLSLTDNIEKILNGAEEVKGKYFKVADTAQLLKDNGLIGDNITISYNVISHHKNKDADHNFSADEWKQICQKINSPLAIVKYKNDYNVFIEGIRDKNILIGLSVKSMGENIEVNAIRTVFAKDFDINKENVVYKTKSPNSIFHREQSPAITERASDNSIIDKKDKMSSRKQREAILFNKIDKNMKKIELLQKHFDLICGNEVCDYTSYAHSFMNFLDQYKDFIKKTKDDLASFLDDEEYGYKYDENSAYYTTLPFDRESKMARLLRGFVMRHSSVEGLKAFNISYTLGLRSFDVSLKGLERFVDDTWNTQCYTEIPLKECLETIKNKLKNSNRPKNPLTRIANRAYVAYKVPFDKEKIKEDIAITKRLMSPTTPEIHIALSKGQLKKIKDVITEYKHFDLPKEKMNIKDCKELYENYKYLADDWQSTGKKEAMYQGRAMKLKEILEKLRQK